MVGCYPHYDISLQILPDTHFIKVHINLTFETNTEIRQTSFFLHKQFQLHSLIGAQVRSYQFRKDEPSPIPYIPEAGLVELFFDPPLAAGTSTWIDMDYAGTITNWPEYSCNVISSDWVELGMYLPWYPLFRDFATKINFHLRVQCPDDYRLAGYGEFIRSGNLWLSHSEFPSQDIVVIASPHLQHQCYQNEHSQINLYSSTFKRETVRRLGENSLIAISCFDNWFGAAKMNKFSLIQSPRLKGGGYGRPGLVVLGGMVEQDYYNRPEVNLRYLAHEFAHAWWHRASVDSWEDWLNEGLAEISAQLVIGERYGMETYHRQIEMKRAKIRGTGPIWQFDRLDQSTPEKQERMEHLLYDRGPVVLHDLCNRIGTSAFINLCRDLLKQDSLTTEKILALIEVQFGMEVHSWFVEQLQTQ